MNNAYITLLSSVDYLPATLILNQNLKDVKSVYPLLVAVTENIFSEVQPYLEKENILYKIIPFMTYSKKIQEDFSGTHILNIASKFALFKFYEYDKLIYLDSDILIYENIDDLFLYPDGAMYDDNGNSFIGLFSFIPKNHNADFYYVLSQIFPLIESDILQDLFFPFKSNPQYRIPFEYYVNITLENLDFYNKNEFKVVHFCYKYKPWHYHSVIEYMNKFNKEFKYSNKNRESIIQDYFNKYLIPLRNKYPELEFLNFPKFDNLNLNKLS